MPFSLPRLASPAGVKRTNGRPVQASFRSIASVATWSCQALLLHHCELPRQPLAPLDWNLFWFEPSACKRLSCEAVLIVVVVEVKAAVVVIPVVVFVVVVALVVFVAVVVLLKSGCNWRKICVRNLYSRRWTNDVQTKPKSINNKIIVKKMHVVCWLLDTHSWFA